MLNGEARCFLSLSEVAKMQFLLRGRGMLKCIGAQLAFWLRPASLSFTPAHNAVWQTFTACRTACGKRLRQTDSLLRSLIARCINRLFNRVASGHICRLLSVPTAGARPAFILQKCHIILRL